MPTWVVRHACAGHKGDWDGPDDDRPLDEAGREQAAALAAVLADQGPTRLVASPTRRCVETLVPLGAALDLAVEEAPELRAASGARLVELLADPGLAGAVLCTHGEVMQPALDRLRADGLDVTGGWTDAELLLKGGVWRLDGDGPTWRLDLRVPVPRATCPRHPDRS